MCYSYLKCNFDINWIDAIISTVIGLIIAWFITSLKEWFKTNRQYKPLSGKYLRKSSKGKTHATIELHHDKSNILSAEAHSYLDSNENPKPEEIWTAEIVMDSPRRGVVVWEMIKHGNPELIGMTGFKRIIISKNRKAATLIGESEKGFGDEKFQKVSEFPK